MYITPAINNFSIYGIYEHYISKRPGVNTGLIHRTMYFPHQDAEEVARIVAQYSRFIILIQQNDYAVSCFQRDVQPHIHAANKPYLIISCMDDYTFPETVVGSFFDTDTSPLFRHWFALNCRDSKIPNTISKDGPTKITPIPYGIDYWTLATRIAWANTPIASAYRQDEHLSKMRESIIHFSRRTDPMSPPKIYINFQFNLNGNGSSERLDAFHTIPKDLTSVQESPVNRYETWGAYTQHVFVASPRGNGMDTVRTWEALILGCIVIVRRIPGAPAIEELYADLPVVLEDKWSDLSREFLDQIFLEYSRRSFKYEKLTTEYWMRRIDAAFDNDAH